jgi:predicted nucleic acid-binding protein
MILADSSVWINHFRRKDTKLVSLLEHEQIVMHPSVIGELSLGNLKNRNQALHDLQLLPTISPATDKEIMEWIERRRIFNRGIGWVDAHILLSCIVNGTELWTADKPLVSVARFCGAHLHS